MIPSFAKATAGFAPFVVTMVVAMVVAKPAVAAPAEALAKAGVFRFHLFREPDSLSPLDQKISNAGYLISQLQSPLLRWQKGAFQPGLAKSCKFLSEFKIQCELHKNLKFSDGSPLTAADWNAHFKKVLDPKTKVRWAWELFEIVGAEEIYTATDPAPALGIQAENNRLTFTLKRQNREFLHRLTSPLLIPFKSAKLEKDKAAAFVGLGAYKLKSWQPAVKFTLEPNLFSHEGHKARPSLEIYFVTEDSVALKLYQSGELHFLRRLPTAFIDRARGKPDYFEIDQIRFDYFGFTKSFREKPENRILQEAMAWAFPYEEMRALYNAKPRPGCFGLPASLSAGAVCFDEDARKARALLAGKDFKPIPALFSQSVDDHRRALEWLQLKLDQNSGLKIRLEGLETKVFLERLERRDASFFRRGVAPDRPTCAGVLENFLPGAPENYLDLDDKVLNQAVPRLLAETSEKKKAQICREVLQTLKNEFVMIPTGPIFFSVLVNPKFKGWKLNELNQLDLKDLHL